MLLDAMFLPRLMDRIRSLPIALRMEDLTSHTTTNGSSLEAHNSGARQDNTPNSTPESPPTYMHPALVTYFARVLPVVPFTMIQTVPSLMGKPSFSGYFPSGDTYLLGIPTFWGSLPVCLRAQGFLGPIPFST